MTTQTEPTGQQRYLLVCGQTGRAETVTADRIQEILMSWHPGQQHAATDVAREVTTYHGGDSLTLTALDVVVQPLADGVPGMRIDPPDAIGPGQHGGVRRIDG